jgi:hypothetical protein
LRQAAAAFFKHDVALRKGEHGVEIVLQERPAVPAKAAKKPSRAELSSRKEREELALMREQLAALLDELPESRQTMRHLGFVEQALAKKGLKALHKLPVDVLQRALEQIEGLVTNWSPVGLASLRSKMAVAIIDREHMDPETEADAYRTAAVLDADPRATTLPGGGGLFRRRCPGCRYAALGNMAPTSSERTCRVSWARVQPSPWPRRRRATVKTQAISSCASCRPESNLAWPGRLRCGPHAVICLRTLWQFCICAQ